MVDPWGLSPEDWGYDPFNPYIGMAGFDPLGNPMPLNAGMNGYNHTTMLRPMVEANGGNIDVYNDSVVVNLNGMSQRYYYDTVNNRSVHGNKLIDNRMWVNTMQFALAFGILKKAEKAGEAEFLFEFVDDDLNMIIPTFGSGRVSWNFSVSYVKLSEDSILVTNQSFVVDVYDWSLSDPLSVALGRTAPEVTSATNVTYTYMGQDLNNPQNTKKQQSKTSQLSRPSAEMYAVRERFYRYSGSNSSAFEVKGTNITARVNFQIVHFDVPVPMPYNWNLILALN